MSVSAVNFAGDQELKPVSAITPRHRIAGLFAQYVFEGSQKGTEAILTSKSASLLTPDDLGTGLQVASEKSHFHIVTLLLKPERADKLAPLILGQSGVILAKQPDAVPAMHQLALAPRFHEVSTDVRQQMVAEALAVDNVPMFDFLINHPNFPINIRPILKKMAKKTNPYYIKEYIKNRPHLPSQFLFEAAQSAVKAQCWETYLAILDSRPKESENEKVTLTDQCATIDMTPFRGKIDGVALKETISDDALGALFIACARHGELILPIDQLSAICSLDLVTAVTVMVQTDQIEQASKIINTPTFAQIHTLALTNLYEEVCEEITSEPSAVMILCFLLTQNRLPHLSPELLERFLQTVSEFVPLEASPDEKFEILFQKVLDKVVNSEQFAKVSPRVLNITLIALATHKQEARVTAFLKCGRFQEITLDTLFTIFNRLYPLKKWSFSNVTYYINEMKDKYPKNLEEIFMPLVSLGAFYENNSGKELEKIKSKLIKDAQLIIKEVYPVVSRLDCPLFISRLDQLFVKNAEASYNKRLGGTFAGAAGFGLWHIAHAILISRLNELGPQSFSDVAVQAASGNQMIIHVEEEAFVIDLKKECPFNLESKRAILAEILACPRAVEIPELMIEKMIRRASERGDLATLKIIKESPRFKKPTSLNPRDSDVPESDEKQKECVVS